jgi:hypothetical protein
MEPPKLADKVSTPLEEIEALKRVRDKSVERAAEATQAHVDFVALLSRCKSYKETLEHNRIDTFLNQAAAAALQAHVDRITTTGPDGCGQNWAHELSVRRFMAEADASHDSDAVAVCVRQPARDGVDYPNRLPDELLVLIFAQTDHDSLVNIRSVCRRFRAVFAATPSLRRHLFNTRLEAQIVRFSPLHVESIGGLPSNRLPGGVIRAAFSGQDGYLWVHKSAHVYKIDVNRNRMVAKLRLLKHITSKSPNNLNLRLQAVSPDGDVFLHSTVETKMYVIHTSRNNAVTSYHLGRPFKHVCGALSASCIVYCLSNRISTYDFDTNTHTVRLELPERMHKYPMSTQTGIYYYPTAKTWGFLDYATWTARPIPIMIKGPECYCGGTPGRPSVGLRIDVIAGDSTLRAWWYNKHVEPAVMKTNIPPPITHPPQKQPTHARIESITPVGSRVVVLCQNGLGYVC